MKFSTTTLFALHAASISTSYAKPYVHHPRSSLRSLKKSDKKDDKDVVISRECELVEFEFKCKSKDKSDLLKTKDTIKYKCSYDEKGLKIKVKYEQEVKSETSDSSSANGDQGVTVAGAGSRRLAAQKETTETEYEVVFDRLMEYAKPDGVVPTSATAQAYKFDEDTTINSINLTKMAPFSKVKMEPNGDIKFQISTLDKVATFFFTISPGGDGAEVTANNMKIDVDIKGYQWQERTSNMAVLANVESGTEVDIDYEDDQQVVQPASVAVRFGTSTIDTSMLRPFGEFTWARDAVVYAAGNSTNLTTDSTILVSPAEAGGDMTAPTNDTAAAVASTTIQVVATSASDGSDNMAFSFVGPGAQMADEIFWDPEAGVGYAPSGAFEYGFAGACGMMLAVMFGAF
mmetsp:Transcript_43056/g.104211  ORF Transcript_43056/g.104211 Transcript_43056/m.104211 type:complete len:402 (+) Transcript_43056:198-1403(+)|eukprot:CAMPEP_0113624616 /NCGR_PEP_ID=MMETSP0017_2-20120614/12697_1 /TAXON_ID=2856 /ORGANISM="Cylindrotheca closterium" /LENGTH=401 /DNA_ID=CAMNT_0000534667 /DNA_START=144 /DNA_END=1349 /DNA_ORIENTATION=- /assembly_acc=CAM_ASM_000147